MSRIKATGIDPETGLYVNIAYGSDFVPGFKPGFFFQVYSSDPIVIRKSEGGEVLIVNEGFLTGISEKKLNILMKKYRVNEKCKECGEVIKWSFRNECENIIVMKRDGVCFMCACCIVWLEIADEHTFVIDGVRYHDAGTVDRSKVGGFLGHGGRKFKIKKFTGETTETNNLWCQGDVPAHFKDRFPDNAEFVNDKTNDALQFLKEDSY